MMEFMKMANNMNTDRYHFDSGLDPQKKKDFASSENWFRPTLMNPVNSFTQNAALSNLNQSYYPAFLQNPLNKNQPGTHIDSIFDKNQEENIRKQVEFNKQMNPEILLRKDCEPKKEEPKKEEPKKEVPKKEEPKKEESKKVSKKPMYSGDSEKDKQKYINKIEKDASNTEFDWMKSNYEAHMLKKILTERNDPAPVLLEAPWSEWTPLN